MPAISEAAIANRPANQDRGPPPALRAPEARAAPRCARPRQIGPGEAWRGATPEAGPQQRTTPNGSSDLGISEAAEDVARSHNEARPDLPRPSRLSALLGALLQEAAELHRRPPVQLAHGLAALAAHLLGDPLPAAAAVGAQGDDLAIVVGQLGHALVDQDGQLALGGELVGRRLVGRRHAEE